MALEFCPRCRTSRGMKVGLSRRTETGAGGKRRIIETCSYTCEACRSFVRSEERELETSR